MNNLKKARGMTKRRSTPGQLAIPGLVPDAFWVVTQGHGVIPDGRRFLVVGAWGDGIHWIAWEDGFKPRHVMGIGTLLREEHFQREADDDAD